LRAAGVNVVDADANGYFKVQVAVPQAVGGAYKLRTNYMVGITATNTNATYTINPRLSFGSGPTASSKFPGETATWTVSGFGNGETVTLSGSTPAIWATTAVTVNANGYGTVSGAVAEVAGGAKTLTATGSVSGLSATASFTVKTGITGVPQSVARTAGGTMILGLHGFADGTVIAANSITIGGVATSHTAVTIGNTGSVVGGLAVSLTTDISSQGLVNITIAGTTFSKEARNMNQGTGSLLASNPGVGATAVLILDASSYSVGDTVKVWGVGFGNGEVFTSVTFGGAAQTQTIAVPITAADTSGAFYTTFKVPDVASDAAATARTVDVVVATSNPAGQIVSIVPKLSVVPGSAAFGSGWAFSGSGFQGAEAITVTLGGTAVITIPSSKIVNGAFNTSAIATAVLTPTSIASFSMGAAGSGYIAPPVVTIDPPTGAGPVQAVGTAVLTGTGVASITMTAAGAGYAHVPTVVITPAVGDPAPTTAATATAVIDGNSVLGVTVNTAGVGYIHAPTISFTATGGDTPTIVATATAALVPTSVASITVTNAGAGYVAAPAVSLSAPPSGTTATATAVLTGTTIASLTLVSGGLLYTTTPTVTVADPTAGTTATFTATMAGGSVTGFSAGPSGSGYTSVPTVTITPSLILGNMGGGAQTLLAQGATTGQTTGNNATATFSVKTVIGANSISITTGAEGTSVALQTGAADGIHGLKASTRYNVMFGGENGILAGAFIASATGTVPTNTRFTVPTGVQGLNIIDLVNATTGVSVIWGTITSGISSNTPQYTVTFTLGASLQLAPNSGFVGNSVAVTGSGLKADTSYDVYWAADLLNLATTFTTTSTGTIPAGTTFTVPPTQCAATTEKTGSPMQVFVDESATGTNVATPIFTQFASLSLSATSAAGGDTITVTGAGWRQSQAYAVEFGGDLSAAVPVAGRNVAFFTPATADGNVPANTYFTVPTDLPAGNYYVDVAQTGSLTTSRLLQRITFTIGSGGSGGITVDSSTLASTAQSQTGSGTAQTTFAPGSEVNFGFSLKTTSGAGNVMWRITVQQPDFGVAAMTFSSASISTTAVNAVAGFTLNGAAPTGTYTAQIQVYASDGVTPLAVTTVTFTVA